MKVSFSYRPLVDAPPDDPVWRYVPGPEKLHEVDWPEGVPLPRTGEYVELEDQDFKVQSVNWLDISMGYPRTPRVSIRLVQ